MSWIVLPLVCLCLLAPAWCSGGVKRPVDPECSSAATKRLRPDTGLETLPADVLENIAERLPLPDRAQLSLSSAAMSGALRRQLAFLGLLHHRARGRTLAFIVTYVIRYAQTSNEFPQVVANRITFDMAVGLYDRLLECTHLHDDDKIMFLDLLIAKMPGFRVVIPGVDVDRCRRKSVKLLQVLSRWWPNPPLVEWHPHMIDGVRRLSKTPQSEQDRGFIADPFRPFRSRNAQFAENLLQYLRDPESPSEFLIQNGNQLRSYQVLRNLFHHGIRFEIHQFMLLVTPSPEILPRLFPLLRKPQPDNELAVRTAYLPRIETYLSGNPHYAAALLRIEEVLDSIMAHDALAMELFNLIIRRFDRDVFSHFCKHSKAAPIINKVSYPNTPLLLSAFKKPEVLSVLLKAPRVNLRVRHPRSHKCSISYLFHVHTRLGDLLQEVPGFEVAKLIRLNPPQFFILLEEAALKNQYTVHRIRDYQKLVSQPFMSEFINVQYREDSRTLLHWAARQQEFSWISTVLGVPNLDPTVTDSHGLVAFQYLLRPDNPHNTAFLAFMLKSTEREKKRSIMQFLVRCPDVVLAKAPDTNTTLLHLAFQRNELLVAAVLATHPAVNFRSVDNTGKVPFAYFHLNKQSVEVFTSRFRKESIVALLDSYSAQFVTKLFGELLKDADIFPVLLKQWWIGRIALVRDHDFGSTLIEYAVAQGRLDIAQRLQELAC